MQNPTRNDNVPSAAAFFQNVRPETRVVLLIDGANLFHTTQNLRFAVDYKRMFDMFALYATVVRVIYFTPYKESLESTHGGNTAYISMQKLIDWMEYNGISVVKKKVQEWTDAKTGKRKSKANLDVDIAVGFVKALEYCDRIYMFSGDGDFVPLISYGKDKGKQITVISSLVSNPVVVSDELRRVADDFIDLKDLRPYIERAEQAHKFVNRTERAEDEDENEEDISLPQAFSGSANA